MPDGGVDENKRATLRRFAALRAATPLVRLGAREASASRSDAPDALVGYIAATPGAHFSKIRDDLKLGTGETQHHLRRLLEAGTVESRRDGDYRRFFIADRFSAFEQVALGYLRRTTPRGMLLELLERPGTTGSELAARLDVSRPTVSGYAVDLDEAGLLPRTDGYAVERPETALTPVGRSADSLGPKAVAVADTADELLRYDP